MVIVIELNPIEVKILRDVLNENQSTTFLVFEIFHLII